MNREIKFRGWFQSIYGQECWVYGYLLKQTNGNWEINNGETSWTVDNVGQFTGVRDMYTKEIYEGDKVIYTLIGDSTNKEIEGTVEWYKHSWRLNRIWLLTEIKSIKVVGNIY
jgi:hypothetical protein